MASDPRSSKPSDEASAKKAYHSPELCVYGDIRTVTQAGRPTLNGPDFLNAKTG
jgi:hypothetical protein